MTGWCDNYAYKGPERKLAPADRGHSSEIPSPLDDVKWQAKRDRDTARFTGAQNKRREKVLEQGTVYQTCPHPDNIPVGTKAIKVRDGYKIVDIRADGDAIVDNPGKRKPEELYAESILAFRRRRPA
jgi:hypothetical protein